MKLSKNWLTDYVDIKHSDLFHKLSLHTAEVEEEILIGHMPHVVVGFVSEVTQHPNADKLRIATVDTGEETPRTIVCGASNLAVGQKVAAALPGAVMPAGFTITVSQLRGVESQGMLCSEDELGLTAERQPGIMVLPEDAPTGVLLEEYLDSKDTVLDIENKSITNRPDLFGHYGIARECSALFDLPLKPFTTHVPDTDSMLPELKVQVESTEICSRYLAVRLENITPKASPEWLQKRLTAIGQIPRNSIVDVTNYIMFDLGLPLHAFDGSKIQDITIGFQKVPEQEVTTLDDKKRSISDEVLLIKSGENAVALAGIMGLQESAISDQTTSIVLEAACFNGSTIRRGELLLNLRTEASIRFEKFLDPELCRPALEKAISLLLEIHPEATVASAITDIYPEIKAPTVIHTSYEFLQQRIGNNFSVEKINGILEKLGFTMNTNNTELLITVPTWRATGDISIPEDIVEELVRMHGYDNLEPTAPLMPLKPATQRKAYTRKEAMNNWLSSHGLYEISSYSFYSKELHNLFGLYDLPGHTPITVQNPLSSEQEIMRTSLAPQLARHAAKESSYTDFYGIFEIEKVYFKDGNNVMNDQGSIEPLRIGLAVSHSTDETSQQTIYETHPLYHIKYIVEDIANTNAMTLRYVPSAQPSSFLHPKRSLDVYLGEQYLGYIGEIHPRVAKALDAQKTIAVCELDFDAFTAHWNDPSFVSYSLLPGVERDISMIVDTRAEVGTIISHIEGFDPRITTVLLKEIFEGTNVGENKKSITLHLRMENPEKTMTDEEIQHIMSGLFTSLLQEHSAEIRGV